MVIWFLSSSRFLAVNGDDGADDILGTLREHILIGKVDDGGFLLAQAGSERTLDAVGHGD